MTRSTIAAIAVSTLLLGCGVSGLVYVKPAWEEQQKLKAAQAGLKSDEAAKKQEVAALMDQLKAQAMSTIAYFDLSATPDKRKTLETKTVETLRSLTEIFNDNKISVQAITPKGETSGLNKPVPTPAPVASGGSPAPGPTPTVAPSLEPGAPTPTPPISLTHKVFELTVTGEYPNLVKALNEMQGLPKAISINEYTVRLLNTPGKELSPGGQPRGGSLTMLELSCQLSITFLMDAPAFAMPAPVASPAPSPISALPTGSLMACLTTWADGWLGEPAWAATAVAAPLREPVASGTVRFTLEGVKAMDDALVLVTRERRTPKYQVVGVSDHLLVIELAETRPASPGPLPVAMPGIVEVVAVSAPGRAGRTQLHIHTDGSVRLRLQPGDRRGLVLHATPIAVAHPVGAAPSNATLAPVPAVRHTVASAIKKRLHPRGRVELATMAHDRAAATKLHWDAPAVKVASPVHHAESPVSTSSLTIVVKPEGVGAAGASPPRNAEAWDRATEATARDWEARSLTHMAEAAKAPIHAPVPFAPAAVAHEMVQPAADPTRVPLPEVPPAPSMLPASEAEPVVEQLVAVQPPAVRTARPATAQKARPQATVVHAVTPIGPQPLAHAGVAPKPTFTRLDGVRIEGDTLLVDTHGALPRFQVLGGNRALLLVEVEAAEWPAPGRRFTLNRAGIKQVRAVPYDAARHTGRLAIDTDGSVRLTSLGAEGGTLRFRMSPLETVASAALSSAALRPATDLPPAAEAAVREAAPVAKPRKALVRKPKAVVARSIPPATRRHRVHKAVARPMSDDSLVAITAPPAHPTASPTPMAVPHAVAGKPRTEAAKPGTVPVASPSPAPVQSEPPLPEGTTLRRSLSSTYRFPIERDRMAGRVNPFKFLPNPKAVPPFVPGAAPILPGPGAVPPPPGSVPAVPGVPGGFPGTPSGMAMPTYSLQAVVLWAGQPPVAVVKVGARTLQVGLNEMLPGNARVKSIQADYVILSANGQDVRLNLRK